MKKLSSFALALLTVTAAFPALGQQWPTTGNFDVSEVEGGCILTGSFEIDGRSDVELFVASRPDAVRIALASQDWSKPEPSFEVTFQFHPGVASYTGQASALTLDGIGNGFVLEFRPNVLDAFASASTMMVKRGETVVDHIDLHGTAAATATLRRCTAAVTAREAGQARRAKEFEYVPRDPFAPQ